MERKKKLKIIHLKNFIFLLLILSKNEKRSTGLLLEHYEKRGTEVKGDTRISFFTGENKKSVAVYGWKRKRKKKVPALFAKKIF
jgi:hypothetical protein